MSVDLAFLDRPVFGLSGSEVLTRIDDITALERRLAAARLECVNEACALGIPAQRGYAHPSVFLREHLKLLPTAATRMLRLAKALPGLPDVADALAKGAISESQAAAIADAVTALGKDASADQKADAVALLLAQAAVLPPRELTLCGKRILHHVAPEAAEERDRKALEKLERNA